MARSYQEAGTHKVEAKNRSSRSTKGERMEEMVDLSKLSDGGLVEKIHDDLYDGLPDGVVGRTEFPLSRGACHELGTLTGRSDHGRAKDIFG